MHNFNYIIIAMLEIPILKMTFSFLEVKALCFAILLILALFVHLLGNVKKHQIKERFWDAFKSLPL